MNTFVAKFHTTLSRTPLVGILRGLHPDEAETIGQALSLSGIGLFEVPLNSPQPLQSISLLAQAFPDALVGAGTVLDATQVRQVHTAGGRLVVAPNFNPEVVRAAVSLGMVCLPGVLTPTEAFAALAAGAHGLKLFPAEMVGPAGLKAMRAVLPADTLLLPVGGVTPDNIATYLKAGANGFGIGSALFKPGMSATQVRHSAEAFVSACQAAA